MTWPKVAGFLGEVGSHMIRNVSRAETAQDSGSLRMLSWSHVTKGLPNSQTVDVAQVIRSQSWPPSQVIPS